MAQPNVHGRFVWQELIAKDTAASAAFYSKVVGWRTQTAPKTPDYTVFAVDGEGVAGVPHQSGDARGAAAHWLPYIGAQNVDETVAAAVKLGGKIIKAPYDLADGGRVAEVADPQGAVFGLYHSSHPGSANAAPAAPGQFSWQELSTTDYEAAFEFYRQLFGWQVMERMNMGPSMVYLIFGWDGAQRGGIYHSTNPGTGAYWLPYASVKDIEATVAAVAKAGGKVVHGPVPVPGGGSIAQLLDTNGAMFAVHALPSAPPAASAPKPAAKPEAKPEAKPAAPKPPKAVAPATAATPAKAEAPAKTATPPAKAAPAPAKAAPPPAKAATPPAAAPAVVKKPGTPATAAKQPAVVKKPAASTKSAAAKKPAKKTKKKVARRAAAAARKPATRKGAASKRPATKRTRKAVAKKGKATAVKRASAARSARKSPARAKKKAASAARRKK